MTLDFTSQQQRTKLLRRSFSTVAGAARKCKLIAFELSSLKDSANTSVYVAMCSQIPKPSARRKTCQRRGVDRGLELVDSFGVTVAQRHSGQQTDLDVGFAGSTGPV